MGRRAEGVMLQKQREKETFQEGGAESCCKVEADMTEAQREWAPGRMEGKKWNGKYPSFLQEVSPGGVPG